MKIMVLGSTGMLGSVVGEHLIQQFGEDSVYLSYRNEEFSWGKNKFYFDAETSILHLGENLTGFDYVINCIGIIKPYAEADISKTILINSLFPRILSTICKLHGVKLIHITTDCVFSGKGGQYTEKNIHDACDIYGKTKSLGEPNNCLTLRTSIIGEELHGNVSLVEWVKSQGGEEVKGFTNHYWNGITTKQYGKICEKIIKEDLYEEGIFHVFSLPAVVKCGLLRMISNKFDLQLKIKEVPAEHRKDMALATVKSFCGKLNIPPISKQIDEM